MIPSPSSNSDAIEGKDVEHTSPKRMNEITVIGNCQTEDEIHVLKLLKQGGHKVAFFVGRTTNEITALKEVDVGITMSDCSTKITT